MEIPAHSQVDQQISLVKPDHNEFPPPADFTNTSAFNLILKLGDCWKGNGLFPGNFGILNGFSNNGSLPATPIQKSYNCLNFRQFRHGLFVEQFTYTAPLIGTQNDLCQQWSNR